MRAALDTLNYMTDHVGRSLCFERYFIDFSSFLSYIWDGPSFVFFLLLLLIRFWECFCSWEFFRFYSSGSHFPKFLFSTIFHLLLNIPDSANVRALHWCWALVDQNSSSLFIWYVTSTLKCSPDFNLFGENYPSCFWDKNINIFKTFNMACCNWGFDWFWI